MEKPDDSPEQDDPVASAILQHLADCESATPQDVARFIAAQRTKGDAPQPWRRYLPAVKNQMVHLARKGRIEIIRKGEPVDPKNFKGLVRIRLKGASDPADIPGKGPSLPRRPRERLRK